MKARPLDVSHSHCSKMRKGQGAEELHRTNQELGSTISLQVCVCQVTVRDRGVSHCDLGGRRAGGLFAGKKISHTRGGREGVWGRQGGCVRVCLSLRLTPCHSDPHQGVGRERHTHAPCLSASHPVTPPHTLSPSLIQSHTLPV